LTFVFKRFVFVVFWYIKNFIKGGERI